MAIKIKRTKRKLSECYFSLGDLYVARALETRQAFDRRLKSTEKAVEMDRIGAMLLNRGL